MKRHHLAIAALVLASGSAASAGSILVSAANHPAAATPAKILTCRGKTVVKPKNFVIACADANAQLTATHWASWTAWSATGTTKFALNLCKPYCAASKISFFPRSKVRLFAPVNAKHGRLFSKLTVSYKLHGKTKTFTFSWSGDPSF